MKRHTPTVLASGAFGVILIAAVLSGCAQKVFTKQGLTQSQWDQDISRCTYEATSSTQNLDYDYQTVFGQSLDQAFRRNDLIELCLRAKGYSEQ